jgi:chromosome segregation ATPase
VAPVPDRPTEGIVERVDGIAAWIHDLDARVRAAELASGDEKTARELRRAVEALSKHDPKLEKRLTNRVDVLADRLATLASTVSTAAASLARKDGEIANLRRELEDGNKRVEGLVRQLARGANADEVEKLRAAVRAVQAERPGRSADARVDGLDGKVAYLNERVDTLATTVATTAAGLVGREGEIANLRQRLDQGAARIEQATAELRRMQGSSTLADRLDTLQSAVDATSAGLGARERDIAAVRGRIDEAYSRVGTVVAELQTSITTLSDQVAALETLPETTERALETRATELHVRVDSLASSLDSTASTLADKDAELAELGSSVTEVSERVDGVVRGLESVLERLPEPGTIDPAVADRLDQLSSSVVAATEQLAAVEATSSTRAEESAARGAALEGLLAGVSERLVALERDRAAATEELTRTSEEWTEEREWVRSRLEALAEAQTDASRAHEGFGPALGELTARLDATASEHATVAADVARISDALESEHRALRGELEALAGALAQATAADDSERMLGELAGRVGSLEGSHVAASAEVARVASALQEEHRALHAELEALAGDLATATAGAGTVPALQELTGRVDSLEGEHAAASAEMAGLATLEAEHRALQAELEALVATVANAHTSTAESAGPELGELTARLEKVERGGAAIASEVARTAAFWAAELEAIESKVDEVAGAKEVAAPGEDAATSGVLAELASRLAAVEGDRQAVSSLGQRLEQVAAHLAEVESVTRDAAAAPAPAQAGEELAELRVAVDGLRMRLASSEQELATLVGTRDLAVRIEEVSRRLETVERAPIALAAPDGGPLPGDGRFRLELRAVELRMEHAEAAARENREAVLVQLERLAARIEWRFQRLEAEYETRHPQAVGGGGQVVPLRPQAEA